MRDELLDEIYAAKKKIAEECDYDFKKLLARYERMQAENPENLVYEVPKTEPEPQQT
jgi:hypothetical protein